MLKFSANLGFLFTESVGSVIDQYHLAKAAGFKAIEHPFPAKNVDHKELLKAKGDMKLVLVNIDTDSDAKFGCASFPGHQEAFRRNFHNTLKFAKDFECKKLVLISIS